MIQSIIKTTKHPGMYRSLLGSIFIMILINISLIIDGKFELIYNPILFLLSIIMLISHVISFYPIIVGLKSFKKYNIHLITFYFIPSAFLFSFLSVQNPKYYFFVFFPSLYGGFNTLELFDNIKYWIICYLTGIIAIYLNLFFFSNEYLKENFSLITLSSLAFLLGPILMSLVSKTIISKNKKIRSLLVRSRKDKKIISKEKAKSDNLFLNILPQEIADELKLKNRTIPKFYESVTVMFTDFAGFTKIANSLSAKELVAELDKCFSYFDSVTKKYKLEKIKTIGDSYMTCAGIPLENLTHAVYSVLAAMEIQSFMNQMKDIKESQDIHYWELRLGINTGSLIAGVIGEMKFTYDVFGDTVNTASRMESSGEAGKINISKNTYDVVKDFFDCEYRGKIPAKNKGLIDMYFVNGIKNELSVNGEKRVPNLLFKEKYKELENIKGQTPINTITNEQK